MSFRKWSVQVASIALVIAGAMFAPSQVKAADGPINVSPTQVPGTVLGNIFKLTGIDPTSLNDGVAVGSYTSNMASVDTLASGNTFCAKDVIGYAKIGEAEIVLSRNGSALQEELFSKGQMVKFDLQTTHLGSWASPEGSASVGIDVLNFFGPGMSPGSYQPLSLSYLFAQYRSPASGTPAAVASVGGYLDSDTMQYTSVYDSSYQIGGIWNLADWHSAASNYGTSIYAGCDGHWTLLFSNSYHGAWVTIDNYGNVGHGGY